MKQQSLPPLLLIFIILNGLLLAVCAGVWWIPMGREFAVGINMLLMQERRYAVKEANYINAETNKQILNELESELDESKLTLLSQSQLLPEMVKIRGLAGENGLMETEFQMDEPILFNTTSQTVMIMNASAVYQGDYNNLYDLAGDYLNSVCYINSLNVSKNESQMTINFSLYGVTE